MHSYVRPHEYVALRLPSDVTKVIQLTPNTNISLGKYGTFPANQIIGRPFYLTFEIQDEPDEDGYVLRVVSAAELHAEALITEGSGEADGEGEDLEPSSGGDGGVNARNNRETVDDGSAQKLTLSEIEALKKQATGAGREIIAKLLESHSALDQKTAFSLAKYTLRKRKKFLKRFTVLPMDVGLLTEWMLEEKDAGRIMELRDELIGLIGCWGNVHHGGNTSLDETIPVKPNGRYLIVDETGGLVVAAMAERMGILYPHHDDEDQDGEPEQPSNEPSQEQNGEQNTSNNTQAESTQQQQQQEKLPIRKRRRPQPMSASGTTLTLLHAHTQPNLSLLKYFGFDVSNPDETHPLHTHLKTLSWLQLVDPAADPLYANEPETVPDDVLATWKPNKRSLYYRKKNRFARVRSVVDETRAGGFDGLIVASLMEPASILKHLVPLLAGSAPVVVYSPTIEPLVELVDLYSTARRTAYINLKRELEERKQNQPSPSSSSSPSTPLSSHNQDPDLMSDFPVDPTLLLAPSLQTARVRPYQVLPGRTHPLMSGRGGAEGYIFHAVRVIPSSERIEARGTASRKKRKVGGTEASTPAATGTGTSAA